MDHQRLYDRIVEKARGENRTKGKGIYYESHHIIPKCLDGNNEKNNLVLLTFKEHFICHKLLTYIYSHNRKIACAYHKMAFSKKDKCHISSRNYSYARYLISSTPVPKETCEKISKGNRGKIRTEEHKQHYRDKIVSKETRQKMQKPKSEEHKQHIREYRTGLQFSDEWKENISKSRLGEKHWAFGKHYSQEWCQNIAEGRKIKIAQLDVNNNIIKIWDSAKDVQDQLKIPKSNICKVCKNQRPKAGGFKWKYYEI